MSKTSKISPAKKVELVYLDNESILIDYDTGRYFVMKGTAGEIWQYIQDETSLEEILYNLSQNYTIDKGDWQEEVEAFLLKLEEFKFINLKS